MKFLSICLIIIALGTIICIWSIIYGYINGKNLKSIVPGVVIGSFFMASGITILLCERFFGEEGGAAALMLITAGFLSPVEYIRISSVFKCTERISAKYTGCSFRSRYYSPNFEYEYDGVLYTGATVQVFNNRFIKRFAVGEYYDVYIDSENPKSFVVKRRLFFADIIIFLLIALCLCAAVGLILFL